MTYPGGKNGAGVYQAIINTMPPHRVYIEPFLGGGAIMRLKRPAAVNLGMDKNRAVIEDFRKAWEKERGWRSHTSPGSAILPDGSPDSALSDRSTSRSARTAGTSGNGDGRLSSEVAGRYRPAASANPASGSTPKPCAIAGSSGVRSAIPESGDACRCGASDLAMATSSPDLAMAAGLAVADDGDSSHPRRIRRHSSVAISGDGRRLLDHTVNPGYKFQFIVADALDFLSCGGDQLLAPDTLIYCDPPYLLESRRSRRPMYEYEMDRASHIQLLKLLTSLNSMVMVSGYWTSLYHEALKGWSCLRFQATDRSGQVRDERLWFNFPPPAQLHDYRFLGSNFRERERIKRKKKRWVRKLDKMPMLERRALMAAIGEAWGG